MHLVMYEKPRVNVKLSEVQLLRLRFTFYQIKIEVMYEKPRVNVKVERGSTFT